mmetsp:Transcript_16812/g.23800  ORF Transcript_16812/g.23800 Transcript_16812/m.23800 type:complete len:255 (+) Transcript_16812:362-1126(+)
MKTQATTIIRKTFYSGDRSKFTWEKFVDIHLEAHDLFEQTGETLTESMKILNLKNGIRDAAMMENTLEAACTSALANSTFTNYVNFLTEGVSNQRSQKEVFKHSTPRQVSGVEGNRGGGHGQGRGRKGRFCGRGFGRGRGRKGCGDSNHGPTIDVKGKTLYLNKAYSDHEYGQLSHAQKDDIRLARIKHKQEQQNKNVSDIAPLICESLTKSMSKAISDGIKHANYDSNVDVSSSVSETPTQQLSKRCKYSPSK